MPSNIITFIQRHSSQIIALVTPLVLLPLPVIIDDETGKAKCGFMLLLMAVYWCTETVPLAVTGFIPVFMAPMFGIMSTKDVCLNYLKDVTVMTTGGLIVALSLENSNLHKRIALRVLLTFGTKPKWLMLGFMMPTWFLSMWISNTATTAMMLPIMEAVLDQLKPSKIKSDDISENEFAIDLDDMKKQNVSNNNNSSETEGVENKAYVGDVYSVSSKTKNTKSYSLSKTHDELYKEESQNTNQEATDEEADYMYFCKGMTLAIAYSANVGGIATLTGTGPNPIMKGHADDVWEDKGLGESPVTYTSWLLVGMPIAIICLGLTWLWLQLFYLGLKDTFGCCMKETRNIKAEDAARRVIEKEHSLLGEIRFAEVAAGISFSCLVFLWFFRSPGFIDGWASHFIDGYIGDAAPAMLMATVVFMIPMEMPKWGSQHGTANVKTLLDWGVVSRKFPWTIIFLMGGGFALADSCEKSELSKWIGEQLSVFGSLPHWLMLIVICALVALLTEVTSNSATCTILMPIMSAMAEGLGMNPLFLMFPTCFATSFSFMLPVATPPNAIAFSYGRLTVMDMVKAGAMLNLIGILVVTLATTTWIMAFFDLGTLPWDPELTMNVTSIAPVPTCAPV